MAKSRRDSIKKWMIDLADKHDISVETVQGFYMSLTPNKYLGTLKDRTIAFFDLYFEGVQEGK